MRGEIVFKGVGFSYGDDRPSLRELSFRVVPGETVAVVGQTGSARAP